MYVEQLLNWVTERTGIIRVSNIKHYSKNKDDNEQVFTVTSHIHFEADIEEFDYVQNSWRPYIADDIAV